MTPLEQALIAAARAFAASLEDPSEPQQPAAQAAQTQTQAAPPQSQPATTLTMEALSTELRNLETQTQGRLFSQISPLLIKYVGSIPGPGGAQMPAGGIQQLPPESYDPFLQDAQALASQLMQGSTTQ